MWSSVGFALHSAAIHQGSRYPFAWEPGIAAALTALGGPDAFDTVVRRGFSTNLDDFHRTRREITANYPGSSAQQFTREPFSYNPIHTTPLIGGIDDLFLSPCVPAIEVRSTVYGIAYSGIERWREAFTHDVGQLFEQYVGRHLRLVEGAEVVHEIEYGPRKSRMKSVDWFLVLPHVVLLIECKAMMPRRDMQEGIGSLAEMHDRLEKPLKQINRSAAAVVGQSEEMHVIPADRPMVGLVVTLGNFDLANAPDVRELYTTANVPTAFIGIDLLEQIVTAPADELDALFADAPNQLTGPGVLAGDGWELTLSENAVLEEAWSSIPLIKFIDGYREAAEGSAAPPA
ncbi:nuclease-related domain-containing protein [Microbacterium sp. VKM Ac-2923]|uniref:nuclease-related domain-containing protein n=1 Tax=Microbacterium sp. VKM Ac-2923 TaxID=2929476 RepID=UPI001FB2D685|nr:nuclease-related domain-containing protein [Microbacterium sp. VKM Ac-2923]MCJ1706902.1 NERD domain-containing protein [Microbacterium sp. VKM Ac-2923]